MKQNLSYTVPVTIFREGKSFVAYSPALDLSSVGKTEKEAKRMFTEVVDIFFEELLEAGTLDCVLKDLGWSKNKRGFAPPKVTQSMMLIKIPTGV
ncbi:MAG: hypothetical protein WCT24_01980 [Patescibacteria group bacterium]